MDFPTIQTNYWDALFAVPIVMVFTQLLKILLKIKRKYVPIIALVLGLCISVFISHRHHLFAGIFMGWFYGYAAIGSYSSFKTAIKSFRSENYND